MTHVNISVAVKSRKDNYHCGPPSRQAFTFSKSAMEILEQCINYVESEQ